MTMSARRGAEGDTYEYFIAIQPTEECSQGKDCANDDQVWDQALQNGFAIVAKDEDYNNMSVLRHLGAIGQLHDCPS